MQIRLLSESRQHSVAAFHATLAAMMTWHKLTGNTKERHWPPGICHLNELHPAKTPFPIRVTESGMWALSRELHTAKALYPMLVTESGIAMLFSFVQRAKA